jgi:hypothetical protein
MDHQAYLIELAAGVANALLAGLILSTAALVMWGAL